MHEEKGVSKDSVDSSTKNSDDVPESEAIKMAPELDEDSKTEVSLDFDKDEEVVKGDDDAFEIPLIDETELALELEKESTKKLSDRLLRLQAEFDNYRKRMNQRFSEVNQYASEGILLKLLDVYDNLERSLQADFKADPESVRKGIQAIHQQMQKIFSGEEVRPITSLGKEFDPYYQNSINTINDETQPDKLVVEEYQKGYMIRDRVLRPAAVCVNRHPLASTVEDPSNGKSSDNDSSEALEGPDDDTMDKDTTKESTADDDYTQQKGEKQ